MQPDKILFSFAVAALLLSCGSQPKLARVRISQPRVPEMDQTDSSSIQYSKKRHSRVVSYRERDSLTGERIKRVELDAVTVTAKISQVHLFIVPSVVWFPVF